MLPFVVSPLYRIGAIVVAVAAFGFACWWKGAEHAERKAEAVRLAQEAIAARHAQAMARRGEELTTAYLMQASGINERARTIEVTKYVTRKADAACPVPVGLVRLWNRDMQASIYQPASGVDDPARDVALSDVARGIIEARRRFEVNRAQCEALQAWAKSLSAP